MGGGGSCLNNIYGTGTGGGTGTGIAMFIGSTIGGRTGIEGCCGATKGDCEGSWKDTAGDSMSEQSGMATSTLKFELMKSAIETFESKAERDGLATAVEALLSRTSLGAGTEEEG